jgi:hypothetical protein
LKEKLFKAESLMAVDMPVYICCSNKLFFTATDANLKEY